MSSRSARPGRSGCGSRLVGFLLSVVVGFVLIACCGGLVVAVVPGLDVEPAESSSTSVTAAGSTGEATAAPTPRASATSSPRTTRAATPSSSAKPKPRPTKAAAAAGAWLTVVGVTDGDTIRVRVGGVTERVRVIGLDTPELRERECYSQQAASTMQSLVQSKKVRLERDPSQDDRDRYGRLLRHVVIPDGRYAAQVLIEGGFGREYTYERAHAHQAAFRAAESRARAAGRGIWSSGCTAAPTAAPVAPPAPAPAPTSSSCVIKGNTSSSGEKIYHVPGGRSYADTVITAAKGERWFCSEADAEAAGWRKARN